MRVLGIDFGSKRVGLALGDTESGLATALATLPNDAALFEAIGRVCRERGVEAIVVGLPLNMDGSRGPQAERATEFADRLGSHLGLPVETWDERLSTAEVERALLAGGLSRKKRKARRDRLAAQLILQSYLDAHRGR